MKKVSCEICGSTDLIKNGDVFICQCCECRYSVEEVRIMVMDDKQQRKTLKSQSNYLQGQFGDNQVKSGKEKWICPECETINMENTCINCGYEKDNLASFRQKKACSEFVAEFTNKKAICLAAAAIISIFLTLLVVLIPGLKDEDVSTYTSDAWKENVLKQNPYKEFDGISRNEICSVTFLDTVKDAPRKAWDVSAAQNGSVLAWAIKNGEFYNLYIAGEGGINAENACERLFSGCTALESVNFNDCFFVGNSTNMGSMFGSCYSLTALDLSSFDTSNVSSMHYMFAGCKKLSVLDVSGWNTSKVTSMVNMFWDCYSLTTLDVRDWDTSNVTAMGGMFSDCRGLSSLDVSNWDTSCVKYMYGMFEGCDNLATPDVSTWDISNVISYTGFMDDGRLINGNPWEDFFE